MKLTDRLRNAWSVFNNKDPTIGHYEYGASFGSRQDRRRLTRGNERSIINAIFTRFSVDVSSVKIRHVRLDDNERYSEDMDSDLNRCFKYSANIDQTGRAFVQDAVMSMLDEGHVVIVPTVTDTDPDESGSCKIYEMRTAKVLNWLPRSVRISLYNDATGQREELTVPKESVAIVENPFYSVMNEPNSTMQRLVRKLNLLDAVDEQSSSGRLDLIVQLPYTVRSEARKKEAEQRIANIERQLKGGKFGIAYTDGTEKVVQLNRPVENNLMKQIEYLTSMLFSQLGITQGILDGSADETTKLNYENRIVEPILSALVDEMLRKFLSNTAISQRQSIMYFKDIFKLAPISVIAEIADKFTRNEIMTSNEIRQHIGMKPSKDPKADQLNNSNIRSPDMGPGYPENYESEEETIQNEETGF